MRKIKTFVFGYLIMAAMMFAALPTALAQTECGLETSSMVTGSLVVADPDQTTRVFRGGAQLATTCRSNPAPTGAPIGGTYNHDAHNFTGPPGPGGCVTVKVETACTGTTFIFVVAYSTFNPATPNTGIVGNLSASPEGTPGSPAYFSFPYAAGAPFTVVVSEVAAGAGCPSYTLTVTRKQSCRQPGYDRDNDGQTDFAVYRPGAISQWLSKPTTGGSIEMRNFGQTNDIPTHGDYTDDGLTDLSVYRPGTNTYYYANAQVNPGQNFVGVPWGTAGDIPVTGDYDGDGRWDIGVFRPSNGAWYILRSGTTTLHAFLWGSSGDTPVMGDYDGDSLADFAVVRPASGHHQWHVRLSNFNYANKMSGTGTADGLGGSVPFWGSTTDKLVPADFNGDGRTDIAVWRGTTGRFYVRQNSTIAPATFEVQWGTTSDIPQPGDYNNDKLCDFAIYRPSGNRFWVLTNPAGNVITTTLGQAGDQPVSAAYRVP